MNSPDVAPCRVPPRRALVLFAACVLSFPAARAGVPEAPEPPVTRAQEVVDEVHGVRIADPFRWLEDGSSEEVRRWVESQNAYTRGILDARPGREAIDARLARLLS